MYFPLVMAKQFYLMRESLKVIKHHLDYFCCMTIDLENKR